LAKTKQLIIHGVVFSTFQMENDSCFSIKLKSIKNNIPLLNSQIDLLIKNPQLEKNDNIEALISTCEFIPRVLDSLLNAEDIF
jgi:hypothetical protein